MRVGSGVGDYGFWRRSSWGSVVLCWIIIFCMMILIDMWLWSLRSSTKYIVSSTYNFFYNNQQFKTTLQMFTLYFGIKMFLSKSIFLCDASYSTGFQQRAIYKRGVIPATVQSCVRGCGNFVDAVHLFFIATIFVKFGSLFMLG